MRNMLYIIWGSLCLPCWSFPVVNRLTGRKPRVIDLKMGAVEVQPGYYENSFVPKNISQMFL